MDLEIESLYGCSDTAKICNSKMLVDPNRDPATLHIAADGVDQPRSLIGATLSNQVVR